MDLEIKVIVNFKLVIWYSTIAYDRLTVNDYLSYINPANLAIIDADPDKKQTF